MAVINNLQRILIPLFFLLSYNTFATVDYLAVNHITKELYWGDEDHEPGLIGWEPIPEGFVVQNEKEYLRMGYTLQNIPTK